MHRLVHRHEVATVEHDEEPKAPSCAQHARWHAADLPRAHARVCVCRAPRPAHGVDGARDAELVAHAPVVLASVEEHSVVVEEQAEHPLGQVVDLIAPQVVRDEVTRLAAVGLLPHRLSHVERRAHLGLVEVLGHVVGDGAKLVGRLTHVVHKRHRVAVDVRLDVLARVVRKLPRGGRARRCGRLGDGAQPLLARGERGGGGRARGGVGVAERLGDLRDEPKLQERLEHAVADGEAGERQRPLLAEGGGALVEAVDVRAKVRDVLARKRLARHEDGRGAVLWVQQVELAHALEQLRRHLRHVGHVAAGRRRREAGAHRLLPCDHMREVVPRALHRLQRLTVGLQQQRADALDQQASQ